MLNVGGPELLIILLVALIFLGPQRLPDVARQLGQMVSSLRSLAAGFQAELDAASKPDNAASMTLDGPTDQADAIAATQPGGVVNTDPFAIKEAARNMPDGDVVDKPVSAGGPKTIDPMDRYLGALGDPGIAAEKEAAAKKAAAEAAGDEEE